MAKPGGQDASNLARRSIYRTRSPQAKEQAANEMEPEIIHALAGFGSTMIFTSSKIPMLVKAFKTKELGSYSLAHLALSNMGNLMYWVYVISLPFGPIWFLQGFFTISDCLLLYCYVRYHYIRQWR